MDDGTLEAPAAKALPHWWSLPPRPCVLHDWRWKLGILGRLFITLGLLIIAFVGYQLWGTGIEFRANQNQLGDQFREAQSSLGIVPTRPSPTAAASSSLPGVSTPSTNAPTTTSAPATLPHIGLGDVIGALKMPSISSKTLYLVAGVRVEDLKHGVGHYPSTPLPGQYGNASLAGHRTTYGAPFEHLDRLKIGDRLIIDTLLGQHYEYVVDSQKIVTPHNTEVLAQPLDQTVAELTLTTCHPKRSTKKRLIIHAHMDFAASSQPDLRTQNYGPSQGGLAGEGTDDTVTSSTTRTTTAPTATAPSGMSTVPAVVPPTAPTTTTSTPRTTDGSGSATQQDSADLARGWFHDRAAWGQILAWGTLLGLLWFVSWWVGQRFSRRWLGPIAVAVPFVVVLYFVFQNVSRLLPPGL